MFNGLWSALQGLAESVRRLTTLLDVVSDEIESRHAIQSTPPRMPDLEKLLEAESDADALEQSQEPARNGKGRKIAAR